MARSKDRRIRIALGAIGLVVAVAYGTEGTMRHDEGVFTYASSVVADGHLPYVAAFDNTGPAGPAVGGAAVAAGRLLGIDDVTAARLAYVPVGVATVLLVFAVARRAGATVGAAAVGAASLLAVPAFASEMASGPRPKLLVAMLSVAAVLAVAHGRWLLAGVVAGCAVLTWQVAIVALGPVVAVAAFSAPGAPGAEGRRRAVARALVGVAIPFGLGVLVYGVAGRLQDLWLGLVAWNVRYLPHSRPPWSLVDAVTEPVRDVAAAAPLTWPLVAAGFGTLLAGAITVLRRERSDAAARPQVTAALAATCWLAWSVVDFQAVMDAIPLLPLAALGVAFGVDAFGRRCGAAWIPALGAAVLVAVTAGEVALHRGTGLDEQRRVVARLGVGGVVSYDDPVLLALAGDRNPVRFFFRVPGLSEHLAGEERIQHAVEALIRDGPAVVAARHVLARDALDLALADELHRLGYAPTEAGPFQVWIAGPPEPVRPAG